MIAVIKKIKTLLNRQQMIRLFILGILMIIGACLETVGVSLIIPFVSAVMDANIIESNPYIKQICEIFDLHSSRTFILLLIGVLIFIFIFKNAFLYFEYYVQYRFVYKNRYATQKKLITAYLNQPYEYFLHVSSAEIMRVVSNDIQGAFALLQTVLGFFTEATMCIVLIIMLFITEPFMTFVIGVILGVLMLVISKVIKPILKNAGLSLQKNNAASYKWILQSVSGIKEIKVSYKEDFFIEQYSKFGKLGVEAEKTNSLLSNVPRLLIEAISISGMLMVIGIMILKGRELNTMIPQLGAFAAAAVRLMPSVNRLSAAYNTISYQEPALDKTIENMRRAEDWRDGKTGEVPERAAGRGIRIKKSIQLSHITYCYPGSTEPVLYDAEMEIPAGKSIGIVGTSGAGKTTAVDILLGLLKPQKGQVLVDGVDIMEDYQGWLSHIGYIPQMIFMLDDSIRNNVAFGIDEKEISDKQIWKALEEAKLDEFVRGLPDGLDTQIGERGVRLSGGQRQRIGIARALFTDPELLIFDEATSALDNETEAAIMESINDLHGKKTMVIIAHRLGTIKNCDLVYRVKEGKIIKE